MLLHTYSMFYVLLCLGYFLGVSLGLPDFCIKQTQLLESASFCTPDFWEICHSHERERVSAPGVTL